MLAAETEPPTDQRVTSVGQRLTTTARPRASAPRARVRGRRRDGSCIFGFVVVGVLWLWEVEIVMMSIMRTGGELLKAPLTYIPGSK